jgi:hypothetical protein
LITGRRSIAASFLDNLVDNILKQNHHSFRLPRLLEVLFGIAVVMQLIAPFVTHSYGVDGRLQLKLISEFTNLVNLGVYIPRWAPDGFFGFGVPAFYYYPPFTFYISSAIHFLTTFTNPTALFPMTSLVATIGSFFTARILIKSIGNTSEYLATLGALLYAFAPFRLAELYGRSSLSTHVAYAFLPLIWYGLVVIVRQKEGVRLRGILILAVSSALLALTSVPVTGVAIVCAGIAAIVLRKQLTWPSVVDIVFAGIVTIGLAAYHFGTVLAARTYAHLEILTVVQNPSIMLDVFHFRNLPAIYYIGIVYIAAIIVAYNYWKARSDGLSFNERVTAKIGFSIICLTAILETPYISLPLWELLQVIQFGWRFYCEIILFFAVIVGIASSPRVQHAAKSITWLSAIACLPPIILVVFNLHFFPHFQRQLEDPLEYLPVHTFSPNIAIDPIQQLDSIARILQPHEKDAAAIADIQGGEYIHPQIVQPQAERLEVQFNNSHLVTFHRFVWPAWHLYANGNEIANQPDSIGRATALLPAGHYTIEWNLERMPLETAGLWISGISWTGILLLSGIGLVRRRVKRDDPSSEA